VNWLHAGYIYGWYVLFGLGFVRWLWEQPTLAQPWWVYALVTLTYFVLIPGAMFGLMGPMLQNISAKDEAEVQEGYRRHRLSRGFAFSAGVVASLVAMTTCAVAWLAASMESAFFSTKNLGENGVAAAIISLMMGIVAVVAVCPWLGARLLLLRCRDRVPGQRSPWLLPILGAILWMGLVGGIGYRLVNAATHMRVQLEFASLPETDDALREWLQSQPGFAAIVHREGETVTIDYRVTGLWSNSCSQFGNVVLIEYETLTRQKCRLPLSQAVSDLGYGKVTKVELGQPRRTW